MSINRNISIVTHKLYAQLIIQLYPQPHHHIIKTAFAFYFINIFNFNFSNILQF